MSLGVVFKTILPVAMLKPFEQQTVTDILRSVVLLKRIKLSTSWPDVTSQNTSICGAVG
jgi:hypothetical protein